jgi:hypothetical protein
MSYNMMIGYDIYDCFTMEHFRLRQRMTLTTKIYCSRLYILNNLLLVFSHFRKKLDILISIASFFGNSKMYCGLHFLFRRAHYYS